MPGRPSHEALSLQLRVVDIQLIGSDIRILRLEDVSHEPLPTFSAGAHLDVGVRLPDGAAATRQYSLAGDPDDRRYYVLGVLCKPDGTGGSRYMHERVCRGDILACSPPRNQFPLVSGARGHLLVAGGIGITPICSMVQALARQGEPFTLHYSAREPSRMAFRGELESLCGRRAKFYFDGGDPEKGINLRALLSGTDPDVHVYVCGPEGLMRSARAVCDELKWPSGRVHFESFTPQRGGSSQDEVLEVLLARSRVSLKVPPGRSILEVALEHGVDLDYDCMRGDCGTCAVGVLEGTPEHRDVYLSAAEREAGGRMCICVSWSRSGRLVLDV